MSALTVSFRTFRKQNKSWTVHLLSWCYEQGKLIRDNGKNAQLDTSRMRLNLRKSLIHQTEEMPFHQQSPIAAGEPQFDKTTRRFKSPSPD